MTYADEFRARTDAAINELGNEWAAAAVAPVRAELDAAQTALAAKQSELEAVQAELAAAENSNTDLTAEVAALQSDVEELEEQRDNLALRVTELEELLAAANARIRQLEDELANAEPRQTKVGIAATAKPGVTYPAGPEHTDTKEYRRVVGMVGHELLARRTFEGTPASWSALKARQHLGSPDTVHFISFKPSIETVGSAGWVGWAEGLIDSFPHPGDEEYRETVVTVQHEASAKPLDVAKFKACFRAFAEILFRLRGDRKISMAWVETGWLGVPANTGANTSLDYWYPGDDVVEVVAPDPYNLNGSKYFALDQADIVGAVQAYEFAKAHGKRFGIAEWGCNDTTASNRAKFITDGTAWAKSLGRNGAEGPPCEFLCWFHSNVPVDDPNDFFLDSSTASWEAFKATA